MKINRIKIIYVLLILVLVGCNSQEKKQEEIKIEDKAPDSLKELSSGIDDIFKSLGDIERLSLGIKLPKEDKKPKKDESSSSGQSDQEESSGGSEGGSGGQEGQASQESTQGQEQKEGTIEEKKQKEIDSSWQTINAKLDEIHPYWNSFETESQKKGTSKEVRDKFKNAFNKMTKAIEDKNIVEIYDYGSQAIRNLKPMYDLYLDDIGGDLSVLKYAAYQGYIRAVINDLEGALEALSNKEENINTVKLKLKEDEEEKEKVEKINLALTDFKDSIGENSRMLLMIKKDVLIENIKALE
ncbi:MAG: hypothetical protein GX231_00950 [Tissierellia bacterium]|nr:hypothetical protein [Tissierellia bacterium]